MSSAWSWACGAIGLCLAAVLAAEAPALQQIGLCTTGFGVPGSGRPLILGNTVLVNSGEGYPTVIDATDKANPKVVRYIPSWYFTSLIYPLPERDLAYLSNSRGPLLVLRGLKELGARGARMPRLQETPWDAAKWGRAFLAGLRPNGIGYAATAKDIVVLNLNDPERPLELARVPAARLRGEGMPTLPEDHAVGAALVREGYQLTFSNDYALSAAILDGGRTVALSRWTSATEQVACGEFPNAKLRDAAGQTAYGRILALEGNRLILGHPASTSKYWRCRKLAFWDVSDPTKPWPFAEAAFDDSETHIRDIALAGRYLFVADGRNIASGHCVARTQRSRLYCLDTQQLVPSTKKGRGQADRLDEDAALPSPKLVASFEDAMPTEYSQMSLVGNTLYVNDYNYGLWVFDVSDPLKPAKLGGAPVSAEGHWLYIAGHHASLAHTFGGAIHAINIADPARPTTVGYYWDGQWLNYKAKIRGRGDAMYLPQQDGLAIVDIAEPARPRRVGEFLDAQGEPLHAPCLDVAASYAFVAASPKGKAPCRLLAYDIAQPFQPALVGTLELKDGKGFRLLAAGKMLYLVGYTGRRILAIDASEPARPRITADLRADSVEIEGKKRSLELKDGGGNGAPGLAFSRGYLYITTALEAPNPYVLIFDVREPAAVRPAGALDVSDRKGWQYFACDVVVEGNRLVLGDYGCEEVYDITEPLAPKLVARYRRSYAWQAGIIRDGLLYVPKLDGLEVLRLP